VTYFSESDEWKRVGEFVADLSRIVKQRRQDVQVTFRLAQLKDVVCEEVNRIQVQICLDYVRKKNPAKMTAHDKDQENKILRMRVRR
jgi:hypothetical protein